MLFKKRIRHKIIIEASPNNGFLMTAGCVLLVYTTPEELLRDLKQYLTDPKKVANEYLEYNNKSTNFADYY